MPADPAVKVNIGGDASGLVAALEQSKQAVSNFGSAASNILQRKLGLKDVFKGVLQGVGIASVNQIADKLVAPFKEAAASAEEIARSTERAANATERLIALRQTDAQQLATAEKTLERMQRMLDSKKSEAPSKSFLGGLIQRGSAFDKLLGLSSSEDNARAEEIQKLTADIGDQAVKVEEKVIAKKKTGDTDELKALRELAQEDEKRKASKEKLADFEKQAAMDKMDKDQKLSVLASDKAKIDKEIAKYAEFIRTNGELTNQGNEELLSLKTKQRDLEKEIADLTEKKATSEQMVANEIRKQNDLRAAMAAQATENTLIIGNKAYGASRSQDEINRASDAELREFVRRQKAEIQSVEATKGRGPGALADAATNYLLQGTVIARLQTDVMRAQSEINKRSGLSRDISVFGEAAARSRYEGDPLRFDQYKQMVTGTQTQQDKTNLLLEQIKKRLEGGIPTLQVNSVVTTGS